MTDEELIAENEKQLIGSARRQVKLAPGDPHGLPRNDLGQPASGYRWQTDAEFAAYLRRLGASQ